MSCRAESSRITLNGLMQGKGKKLSAPCSCFLQHNGQTMFPEVRRTISKTESRKKPKK